MMRRFIILLLFFSNIVKASPLYPVLIDVTNKPSLQRGARIYVNYCAGCHSLRYVHYQQLAKDIGVTHQQDQVLEKIVKEDLIFNDAKINDIIQASLPAGAAKKWFGVIPPDLSLMARVKGADWLYTYLRSFYKDPSRIWGTNNLIAPDIAMPNILIHLQGVQIPIYKKVKINGHQHSVIDHLVLVEHGKMTPTQYNAAMTDLVNFLVYVSEPTGSARERLGWWVLTYLAIMSGLIFYLRKVIKS